jgi:VIT1/CCC1 family predicted Fe2+/Mn2+ transporter
MITFTIASFIVVLFALFLAGAYVGAWLCINNKI